MGASSSSQLQKGGSKSIDLGDVWVFLTEAPVTSYLSAEPRVILANKSDYTVSYWVVEEAKKRTKAQHERVATSIGLELNAGKAVGRNWSEDLKKRKEGETLSTEEEEEEEVQEADDVVYFLTRDHRMGQRGSTQPTQVPFPADCQHVRVYGFFETDGEWRPYKNKIYSIALRNKNFRITATTSKITTPRSTSKETTKETKRREKQVTA